MYTRRNSYDRERQISQVPGVLKLINQCKSEAKDFRLITKEEYLEELKQPQKVNINRMTIVVDKNTGTLVIRYWG